MVTQMPHFFATMLAPALAPPHSNPSLVVVFPSLFSSPTTRLLVLSLVVT